MIELRVSSVRGISRSEAASLLLELGVEASIVETLNVISQPFCHVEPGLQLLLPSCEPADFSRRVWPELKRRWGLSCGWMDASQRGFRGCTENFCRESVCPSKSLPGDFAAVD
jgi:hypothetical protein